MSSTQNPYTSYHVNFDAQKGLEWMTEGGAYQHTTISGHVSSSQPEPYQDWISQQLMELMAGRAHINAKLRELQELYRKQQDTLTRLRAFNGATTNTMWNIPHQPTYSTSSSTTPYTQTVTHPPPEFIAHNRTGKNASGSETFQQGELAQHRETFKLEHAKKSHICHCGKGYTRKDSLLRHAIIHTSENPYL